MKKILIFISILISCSCHAQDSLDTSITPDTLHYSIEGLTPEFIVTNALGSQSEIYKKSINWIKETYKNPDAVIKTTIENEKIRFEGMGYLTQIGIGEMEIAVIYVIELSFKDGRYRFLPLSLHYVQSFGAEISLKDGAKLYKKNGIIRPSFKYYPTDIEDLFNGLNQSLCNYLNKTIENSDDDW